MVWWVILYSHGDLTENHMPHANISTEWKPCVSEIYGFTSIFLFSIEIHTTIGYGSRTITLECPSAWLAMCLESIIGTITQSFIVGIVFAKLTRPKSRAKTLIFSKHAIINQRDCDLCLIFRVGNTRKSRIIDIRVHAYLIRCVNSGDLLNEQLKLSLSVNSAENVPFIFPISVVHVIDENSPFFTLSANDILKSRLEVVVVFEGVIESTGQPVQAKSSYIAREILWGHRFVQVIDYHRERQGYVVNFSKFDETIRINSPLCSAQILRLFYNNF